VAGRATLILGDGAELELREEYTIGRAEENDLALDQSTVSRHHAVIVEAEERWFLEDRGSFNGTS
jgi:pSer/pThr/pTyr-binding forkhead associated (FHA) protein